MDRIRIGVTANFMHADPDRVLFRGKTLQYFESRMVHSVWRSGAIPVPIPDLGDDGALASTVEHIDGLLLTGGADVAPQNYGEEPLDPAWGGDAHRDAYEIRLVNLSLAAGRPILALCRGIQLVNVALGGSLYQDITTQIADALVHRDWHRYDELGHEVSVSSDSVLARLYGGAKTLGVNSIHHQAVKAIAPGLTATAWAPDGVVEALEQIEDDRWILAVQWHPEWLEPDRVRAEGVAKGWADGRVMFDAFIDACRARRALEPR